MWVIHKRLAALHFKNKKEGLTPDENEELTHCLEANLKQVEKLVRLENLSLIAYSNNDTNWHHQICRQIDELKEKMYI